MHFICTLTLTRVFFVSVVCALTCAVPFVYLHVHSSRLCLPLCVCFRFCPVCRVNVFSMQISTEESSSFSPVVSNVQLPLKSALKTVSAISDTETPNSTYFTPTDREKTHTAKGKRSGFKFKYAKHVFFPLFSERFSDPFLCRPRQGAAGGEEKERFYRCMSASVL